MLIGIKGYPKAGKDTVCKIFKELDNRVERIAFADKVKKILAESFGVSVDAIEAMKIDENFYFNPDYQAFWVDALGKQELVSRFNIRMFLQRFATEAIRNNIDKNFWINLVLPLTLMHEGRFIVVTDMRFANEMERIKFLQGHTVLIKRDSLDVERHQHHESEALLDPENFDYIIENNGTLEELKAAVEAIYIDLFKAGGPTGGVQVVSLNEEQRYTHVPSMEGNDNGNGEHRAIEGSPKAP